MKRLFALTFSVVASMQNAFAIVPDMNGRRCDISGIAQLVKEQKAEDSRLERLYVDKTSKAYTAKVRLIAIRPVSAEFVTNGGTTRTLTMTVNGKTQQIKALVDPSHLRTDLDIASYKLNGEPVVPENPLKWDLNSQSNWILVQAQPMVLSSFDLVGKAKDLSGEAINEPFLEANVTDGATFEAGIHVSLEDFSNNGGSLKDASNELLKIMNAGVLKAPGQMKFGEVTNSGGQIFSVYSGDVRYRMESTTDDDGNEIKLGRPAIEGYVVYADSAIFEITRTKISKDSAETYKVGDKVIFGGMAAVVRKVSTATVGIEALGWGGDVYGSRGGGVEEISVNDPELRHNPGFLQSHGGISLRQEVLDVNFRRYLLSENADGSIKEVLSNTASAPVKEILATGEKYITGASTWGYQRQDLVKAIEPVQNFCGLNVGDQVTFAKDSGNNDYEKYSGKCVGTIQRIDKLGYMQVKWTTVPSDEIVKKGTKVGIKMAWDWITGGNSADEDENEPLPSDVCKSDVRKNWFFGSVLIRAN